MRFVRYALLLALLVAQTARAQTVPEANSVLNDIAHWLPGTWSTEPFDFFDAEMDVEDAADRPRVQLVIESESAYQAERMIFGVQRTVGDAEPERLRLEFAIDDERQIVSQTEVETGCLTWWRRGATGLYGVADEKSCEDSARPATWQLSARELTRVDVRDDHSHPLRFSKARWYECFALVNNADDDGITMRNPFQLHDAGGVYRFETDDAEPRQIEVLLRRSMWPSRSGNNFVPLLQLNVYENGDNDTPLANAWSDADSGRVGFATRGVGSARCKLSEED